MKEEGEMEDGVEMEEAREKEARRKELGLKRLVRNGLVLFHFCGAASETLSLCLPVYVRLIVCTRWVYG